MKVSGVSVKWDKIPDDKLRVEYKVLEELFHRHVKHSGEYIEQLKEELEKEKSVVDLYADMENWENPVTAFGCYISNKGYFDEELAKQRQKERRET